MAISSYDIPRNHHWTTMTVEHDKKEKKFVVTTNMTDERSNGIERLAFSLNNNCAVTPSTNKIPMMSSSAKAIVKFTYEPRLEDELRLIKGEQVCVFENGPDGWWKGEAPNGSVGWFPSNYVEMLNSRGFNSSMSIICRKVKDAAYNFSDAQVKVREATSCEHQDPSTALMSEIADLTHNPKAFTEIMSIIWKRLNDSGKNWRRVRRSLVLLEILIVSGHEKVAQQCRENISTIETLKDFQHVEEDFKDRLSRWSSQGMPIREKATQITSLISDDERLKNERTQFILTRNKFKHNNPGPVGVEALEEFQKEADRLATTKQGTVSSAQLTQWDFYDLLSLGVGDLVNGHSNQPLSSGAWSSMGMADALDVPQSLTPASAQTNDGLLVSPNNEKTSTSQKNLSDMPVDVVGLIIERSDYKEQLILRKTSNSLRAIVEQQKPALKRLRVSCRTDCIICEYNDHLIAYASPSCDFETVLSDIDDNHLDSLVLTAEYEQVAFDDLASTLKNPKLQLETFSFDSYCDDDCCKDEASDTIYNKHGKMENFLKSINHHLSVKACNIALLSFRGNKPVLSHLKPGRLETIVIDSSHCGDEWSNYSEEMDRVALLEQWKQAKELEVHCFKEYDDFPAKHVTHFKRFHFEQEWLDPEYFVLIRNLTSEHENIEFCTIVIDENSSWLLEEFNDMLGTLVSPNLYHYTIPDSEYYLELLFSDNRLTIEKKKK